MGVHPDERDETHIPGHCHEIDPQKYGEEDKGELWKLRESQENEPRNCCTVLFSSYCTGDQGSIEKEENKHPVQVLTQL